MNTHVQGSSRNERCPVCGEKMKVCGGAHTKRSYTVPIVFLLLGLICIVSVVIMTTDDRNDTPHAKNTDTVLSFQRIGREYVHRYREDTWWWHIGIIDEPDIPVIKAHLEFLGVRTNALITKYRDTNTATERIAAAFPLVLPSLYTYGTSQQFFLEEDYDPTLLERSIELCCISTEQEEAPGLESTLAWYRADWNALMIHAVEIPDAVLVGLVYHELAHAFAEREGRTSARASPDSDAYVLEELEAHDLVETPILNAVTRGQFSALITAILARNTAVASPGDVIALVTPADLTALDAMLGMNTAGRRVAETVYAHFAFALLAAHTDRTAPHAVQEKVRLYRWLRQQRL